MGAQEKKKRKFARVEGVRERGSGLGHLLILGSMPFQVEFLVLVEVILLFFATFQCPVRVLVLVLSVVVIPWITPSNGITTQPQPT